MCTSQDTQTWQAQRQAEEEHASDAGSPVAIEVPIQEAHESVTAVVRRRRFNGSRGGGIDNALPAANCSPSTTPILKQKRKMFQKPRAPGEEPNQGGRLRKASKQDITLGRIIPKEEDQEITKRGEQPRVSKQESKSRASHTTP